MSYPVACCSLFICHKGLVSNVSKAVCKCYAVRSIHLERAFASIANSGAQVGAQVVIPLTQILLTTGLKASPKSLVKARWRTEETCGASAKGGRPLG